VVQYKKLMDQPDQRSSHLQQTPTLGGIAFFVSIVMGVFFIKSYDVFNINMNIIAGITILFIIGLKDDLMVLAPKTKIIAQFVAITFVLINTGSLPTNFYGFLGLTEIPLWLSIVFAYFVVLSIINAYNLIDGIDGLASMVGIVIFTVFAFIFYSVQLYYFSLLAIIGIGFLVAFLRYNLSSKRKIFMGDTGSMIVGFLISVLTLRFLALNTLQLQAVQIQPRNLLWITLTILFVPFMDTIRVFTIRVLNKKGPFSPDRNHVHHILIDLGLTHIKASSIITGFNVLIILIFYKLNTIIETKSLIVLFVILTLFTILLLFHLNTNFRARKQKIFIKSSIVKIIRPKKKAITFRLASIFRVFF